MTVRSADPADLPRIAAIYDEQVATAVSTFDLEPAPAAYWQARLVSTEPGDHVLVAELARMRADGVHRVLAVVALPNPASEALHRACGFEQVGLLPEVGRKFDRWVDTGLWARRL